MNPKKLLICALRNRRAEWRRRLGRVRGLSWHTWRIDDAVVREMAVLRHYAAVDVQMEGWPNA